MITDALRSAKRNLTSRHESAEFERAFLPLALILGGLALVGAIALGVWGYPELRRTIHMHRM